MSPYELLNLAAQQITRATGIPAHLAPATIKGDAPTCTLYVGALDTETATAIQKRDGGPLKLRVRLVYRAHIEGPGAGLRLAMDASWMLTKYLASEYAGRIELANGTAIANSRFSSKKHVSGDLDSVFEDAETAGKATMEETWTLNLEIPASLAD